MKGHTVPTLRELEAIFLSRASPSGFYELESTDLTPDVQGIMFYCPLEGPEHAAHHILVWFANRSVPDACTPLHRWNAMGTSIDNLTLSPSINLDIPWKHPNPEECPTCKAGGGHPSSCKWHGFIINGKAA